MPSLSDFFSGASIGGLQQLLAAGQIGVKIDITLESDSGERIDRTVTVNAPGTADIGEVVQAAVQAVAEGAFRRRRGKPYPYTIVAAEVSDIFFTTIENPLLTL